MMPNIPPHFGMDQETKTDQIARAQQHIDDSRRLAFSLSECFRLMMINPDKDPEFCLSRARDFEDALATWLTRSAVEHLESLQKYSAPDAATQAAEMLGQLVQQRNTVEEQVEAFEKMSAAMCKTMGERGEVMAGYFEAIALPYQQQLEGIEQRISELQRTIEKSGPKDEPTSEAPQRAGGNA
jgi:hypothetical protein